MCKYQDYNNILRSECPRGALQYMYFNPPPPPPKKKKKQKKKLLSYIVNFWFTGMYHGKYITIFLTLALKHRLWVLVKRKEFPLYMFRAGTRKIQLCNLLSEIMEWSLGVAYLSEVFEWNEVRF